MWIPDIVQNSSHGLTHLCFPLPWIRYYQEWGFFMFKRKWSMEWNWVEFIWGTLSFKWVEEVHTVSAPHIHLKPEPLPGLYCEWADKKISECKIWSSVIRVLDPCYPHLCPGCCRREKQNSPSEMKDGLPPRDSIPALWEYKQQSPSQLKNRPTGGRSKSQTIKPGCGLARHGSWLTLSFLVIWEAAPALRSPGEGPRDTDWPARPFWTLLPTSGKGEKGLLCAWCMSAFKSTLLE